MSIVFTTIPGNAKREFGNLLHTQTGGAVQLVVVQKPKKRSLLERFLRLQHAVGVRGIPKELWYAALLRMHPRAKRSLEYFREISSGEQAEFVPPTLEVENVNSDEVFEALRVLKPKLLVVWGCTLLKPHILALAEQSINLHFGYCPYYRGALANQQAVLAGDYEHVGATIHHVNAKVDEGDVLAVLAAGTSRPPRELFLDLNSRARDTFLDIAVRLHGGETLPRIPQESLVGNTLLLKHWQPSLRYKLGRHIAKWEDQTQ